MKTLLTIILSTILLMSCKKDELLITNEYVGKYDVYFEVTLTGTYVPLGYTDAEMKIKKINENLLKITISNDNYFTNDIILEAEKDSLDEFKIKPNGEVLNGILYTNSSNKKVVEFYIQADTYNTYTNRATEK
jgi:hypothetical protein